MKSCKRSDLPILSRGVAGKFEGGTPKYFCNKRRGGGLPSPLDSSAGFNLPNSYLTRLTFDELTPNPNIVTTAVRVPFKFSTPHPPVTRNSDSPLHLFYELYGFSQWRNTNRVARGTGATPIRRFRSRRRGFRICIVVITLGYTGGALLFRVALIKKNGIIIRTKRPEIRVTTRVYRSRGD